MSGLRAAHALAILFATAAIAFSIVGLLPERASAAPAVAIPMMDACACFFTIL
jgi:hypothetical protein